MTGSDIHCRQPWQTYGSIGVWLCQCQSWWHPLPTVCSHHQRLQDRGEVTLCSTAAVGGGGGYFQGSHDCIACCAESAFEVSADASTWVRVARGKPAGSNGDVQIELDARGVVGIKWVRYAFDWLVQCPFFDRDGLPLGPFSVLLPEQPPAILYRQLN